MNLERSYLFIFISVVLSAVAALEIMPLNFTIMGYFLVASAIHTLPTAVKELRAALKFTYVAIGLTLALSLLPRILPALFFHNIYITSIMFISYAFVSAGIYFWLLKAEYMWAPHSRKRMDLYIFSGVTLVYLLVNTFFYVSWMNVHLLVFAMRFNIFGAKNFVQILYYAVLLYLIGKLYMEAKNNGGGLRRWR